MPNSNASLRTIERLCIYRRILRNLSKTGVANVYSHQLAKLVGVSAAQIRRDLMVVGYTGSPTKGYQVNQLLASISEFLDNPCSQNICIIGVGNLGRAILAYIPGRHTHLNIVAGFDVDEHKINRVIVGCRCYHLNELVPIVKEKNITVAIIATPAETAQDVANRVISSGIKSILNFAPITLKVPKDVFVEYIDISVALEKAAYFAKCHRDVTS